MNWETVIGLETHVELASKSKIFCACTTAFGGAPNTHCCPVCTGMPGALPVLNGKVVEYAVRAALALGCTVTRYSRFDRKNYFYPDLPKAYQISQLYLPIGRDGTVEVGGRTVGIHELHMEEDAGLVAQVVEQVLSANEKSVADYRSGKEKAFGFLVGQVMRQLRGQAAPAVVRQVLLEQLAEQ